MKVKTLFRNIMMTLANRAGANAKELSTGFKSLIICMRAAVEGKIGRVECRGTMLKKNVSVKVIVNLLTALSGWTIFVCRRVFEAAHGSVMVAGTVKLHVPVTGIVERWNITLKRFEICLVTMLNDKSSAGCRIFRLHVC